MSIAKICNREPVVVRRQDGIREVAQRMRETHVGCVVVVDEDGATPAGVLTDRDLVIEVLASELDLDAVIAGDLMSREVVTAGFEDDVFETIRRMREHCVRRLPVVDPRGHLAGLVSLDDLLELLVDELGELVSVVRGEIGRERELR